MKINILDIYRWLYFNGILVLIFILFMIASQVIYSGCSSISAISQVRFLVYLEIFLLPTLYVLINRQNKNSESKIPPTEA